MDMQCKGITKSGSRCKNKVSPEDEFCTVHSNQKKVSKKSKRPSNDTSKEQIESSQPYSPNVGSEEEVKREWLLFIIGVLVLHLMLRKKS
ncbi:DUF5763 domain-containing protein [Chitinispirillales bacterium ANBcel5]|uniref:DUF5763 domain-containing protein n=1 Tax=Cellulosispirillum alkaliphilum TaxID=3039283 RepID=UPI002A4F9B26|nr:DUF5763 domain-containing protein [Chitinispirillales bacterium ANBcel5]